MKQSSFTVARTRRLTRDVWELVLTGDTSAVTAPGQFVNLALPEKFLRRPSPSATGRKTAWSCW